MTSDNPRISTANIVKKIQEDKASAGFKRDTLKHGPAYQIAKTRPDMIQQITPDDTVITGHFQNGMFIPSDSE